MAVNRDKRNGKWRYRKMLATPEGKRQRISGTPAINTKQAAEAAERDHIQKVMSGRPSKPRMEVPSLNTFKVEFMRGYVAANNKPSEQIAKEYLFKHHLLPEFGRKRLDEITTRDVEAFKAKKIGQVAPKTVNNMLACLSKCLRYAEEIELINKVPRIRLLRVAKPDFDFLTFEEYERLIGAAHDEPEALAAILLAGDAGIRVGEIRALQWDDMDLEAGRIVVQRTDYRGHTGSPKGGRNRTLPMTSRLQTALRSARTLKGPYVLSQQDGAMWNRGHADTPLRRARKRAGLRKFGWHVLRHTFCSHAAMTGVPVRTIQELAGHSSIQTTLRYMHLTPSALNEGIQRLERNRIANSVATANPGEAKVM